MWQYTIETIINSNKGHLGTTKDKRFDVQQGKLLIEGVGAFDLAKITKVWKRAYQPALPAKAELTIPAITKGEYYRLQVWVSEEGTIRPELQNAMLMKSLPFQFEVKASSTAAADLAAAFAKAVKNRAEELGITADETSDFEVFAGNGLSARIEKSEIIGGNLKFITEKAEVSDKIKTSADFLSESGKTPLVFAKDGKARCVIKRQSFEDMWALDCDTEL